MNAVAYPQKLPFDALIFDVGGIFILHDNERLFRRLASSCSAADAVDCIRETAYDPDITTGVRPVRAIYDELAGELGYRRDWHGFVDDWSSHFSVDHAMLALLAALARDNRVLLFSNTNREHWEHVTQLADGALGRYQAYLSHQIGDMKPRASAFQFVAARAGIRPQRALFVDDLAENVAAARALGFCSHIYSGRKAFEQFLAALPSTAPEAATKRSR
ncbi:MAG TPA: HAD-IA family hydrolase [Stellaceae bacterium]|jgi:FMN phosphatase YigB (HAD superfamily)|nr:HAD-IA family hydrolase [Stellaceae bacterium]